MSTISERSLVLGAGGFIGSNLCTALVKAGQTVRAFNRAIPDNPSPSLEWMQGDFHDKGSLSKAVSGCSTVYHLIATTLPAPSNANPAHDAQTNILSTLQLLEVALANGVKKIVFASSGGTVYGITNPQAIKETHATNPICAYGISKLAIEKYLHLYYHLHGLNYCILRVANAYGPNQKGTGVQGIIGTFLAKIMLGQCLEIWGDGEVVRDFIHVADVAAALVKAKDYQGSERVFNIGSGQGHSVNDLLSMLEQLLGKPIEKHYTAARNLDVPYSVLDIRRAQKYLSWQPTIALEHGIRELLGLWSQGHRGPQDQVFASDSS